MTKKIAIMQPYFFPYIGYWQLMNIVDEFVVYDNIQYTKKGWVNRNRYLQNGHDKTFTLPLKKASDFLEIKDRMISEQMQQETSKLIRKIEGSYREAPYFSEAFSIFKKCVEFQERNLFKFILNSIQIIKNYLGIETKLVSSSTINIDHSYKSSKRVQAICKALSANMYINPIGGIKLYDKKNFALEDITLLFHKTKQINYAQFDNAHVSNLSILDVMMFNSKTQIKLLLEEFELQ